MPIKLPFRPRRETYPADLWTQCPNCEEMLFNKQLDKLLRVCPTCSHQGEPRILAVRNGPSSASPCFLIELVGRSVAGQPRSANVSITYCEHNTYGHNVGRQNR